MTTLPVPRWSDRQYLVINALAFQGTWLFCVLGGSLVALPTTLLMLALHLHQVHDVRRESLFIAQATAIGFLCDLALVSTGVMVTGGSLPPLWLTCLWTLFATTVGYPMRFFFGRFWLSVITGAVFAPMSYFAGARLAGVGLMSPDWLALLIIALIWAAVFPLLIHLYTFNRLRPIPQDQ